METMLPSSAIVRAGVLGASLLFAGCEDSAEIPLQPDEDPLYSAAFMSRDNLLPVPRTTLPAGSPVEFAITVFHQRAVADTQGVADADLSIRLWAQDRLTPATSTTRVLIADTVLPIESVRGVATVTGTTDTIPSCLGMRFFYFDLRLRSHPVDGPVVVLFRDSETARIEEATSC
jgi:hypothetical protein